MDKELERYFRIVGRINAGTEDVDPKDLQFFLSYSPKIDQAAIDTMVEKGYAASPEQVVNGLVEVGRKLQSSPEYKDKLITIAKNAERGRLSEDLTQGINLVLAGSDIAQSIQQIQQSKRDLSRSRRPSRPAIPARDQLLQQSLRETQEGINDPGRAVGAARAEIQDQYQNDIANAKTASTGQAGAYGSYAQVAADRRNRAALGLAPIQDEIRRGQQARQDQLLGMRMDETQQQFQNQAQFYPQDLYQYNQEQQAAGRLGATGRSNLRNSLYGLGQQVAPAVADYATERRYRNLYNSASNMYGTDVADTMLTAQQNVEKGWEDDRGLPAIADYWVDNPIPRTDSAGQRLGPSSTRQRYYPGR
jgi:hypothetical protein